MGRKLHTDQHGVFPRLDVDRYQERDTVIKRALATRAGLPTPERVQYNNLGNRDLPVYRKKDSIQRAFRDHQLSMVEGPTGSGKSTQIAQYALEMGYKKIVYLEPRVFLADNLADQLERELTSQLGSAASSLVGVRHSERSTGYGRAIEIMTPGTFMRVADELDTLEDEPVLILADEIHEKDFETELAVASSVKKLMDHSKWRMVLASATLDTEPIQKAWAHLNGSSIPITSVEGRPHELQTIEEPGLDAVEAYKKYGADHDKTLIFTAGKAEIEEIIGELKKETPGHIRLSRLHAKLSRSKIRQATQANLAEGEQQIIVSTSAGQSGITIPGLSLVISDGTTRRPDLDRDGTPGLFKQYCAQDELIQQAGRAGRDVAGGMAIYTKPTDSVFDYLPFDEHDPQAPAQIYHTNISRNVLLTASYGSDFYDLNKYLINKVDQRTILEAHEVLYRLGALDEHNVVTETGRLMNQFPLRPELSRGLAAAVKDGANPEMLTHLTATLCSIEAGGLPYFEKGIGSKWRDDIRPETNDDYIAQLDMFYATRQFYSNGDVDEAALEARNYDMKNTYRAHKTFDKIARTLNLDSHSLDTVPPTDDQIDDLHDYLLAGLFDFAHTKAARNGDSRQTEYVSVHDRRQQKLRELSSRGTYAGKDQLVVGMPRRFEKKNKGELVEHSTIENVFPTSLRKLTRHVMHLTERSSVTSSQVVGGYLQRNDELRFGSIKLDDVPSVARLTHTDETKEQLRQAAHDKPTQTLDELTSIKKHLEHLLRLAPADEINNYFPKGILTDEWLKETVTRATDDDVDSIYLLDNKLRSLMIHDNLSVRAWISEEHEQEILERSPQYKAVGETEYALYYSHGSPIINGFNLKDADNLPDGGLYLADGREILISYRVNQDTKRYPAIEIKKYANELNS